MKDWKVKHTGGRSQEGTTFMKKQVLGSWASFIFSIKLYERSVVPRNKLNWTWLLMRGRLQQRQGGYSYHSGEVETAHW
eukprot:scaffold2425_cov149-Ochromonas_danica.AAC.1